MEVILPLFFILFGSGIWVLFWIKTTWHDEKRIAEFVASFGGELVSIKSEWLRIQLFYLVERARTYRVRYRDKAGCIREALIRTSWLDGSELLQETNFEHRRREREIRQRSEDVTRRLQERIDQSRATAKFDADKRG